MSPKFKKHDTVRLTHIEHGDPDIPIRYVGRKGTIVKQLSTCPLDTAWLYDVQFPGRRQPLPIFEDELVLIDTGAGV